MLHFWKACVRGIRSIQIYLQHGHTFVTHENDENWIQPQWKHSNFIKLGFIEQIVSQRCTKTNVHQNEYLIIPTITVVSIIVVVAAVVIVVFIIFNIDNGAHDDDGDNNNDNNNDHDNDDDGHDDIDVSMKTKVASQIYMLNIVTEVSN